MAPPSIVGERHQAAIDVCTACSATQALYPHLSTSSTSSVSIAALSVASMAGLSVCLSERGTRPCSQVSNQFHNTLEQEQPADTSEASTLAVSRWHMTSHCGRQTRGLDDWLAVSKANSKSRAVQLTMLMARPVIGAASWKNRGVVRGDCGFREKVSLPADETPAAVSLRGDRRDLRRFSPAGTVGCACRRGMVRVVPEPALP